MTEENEKGRALTIVTDDKGNKSILHPEASELLEAVLTGLPEHPLLKEAAVSLAMRKFGQMGLVKPLTPEHMASIGLTEEELDKMIAKGRSKGTIMSGSFYTKGCDPDCDKTGCDQHPLHGTVKSDATGPVRGGN